MAKADRNMNFNEVVVRLNAGLPVTCNHNVLVKAQAYLMGEKLKQTIPMPSLKDGNEKEREGAEGSHGRCNDDPPESN